METLKDFYYRESTYIDGIEYIPKEIETWKDPKTGLIWEKFGSKKEMPWEEAFKYAEKLGDGWRLPTVQELFSLIDFIKGNPACKITNTYPSSYWSSTIFMGNIKCAWYVNFNYGHMRYSGKNFNYYVRCVKGD